MAFNLSRLKGREMENPPSCCSVVVAAAGSSTRMVGQDKLFIDLGGMPVLAHTLKELNKCREVAEIIVVTRQEKMNEVAEICARWGAGKVKQIVQGGPDTPGVCF